MIQLYLHGLGQTPASWDPLLHLLDASKPPRSPPLNPHKEVPL